MYLHDVFIVTEIGYVDKMDINGGTIQMTIPHRAYTS